MNAPRVDRQCTYFHFGPVILINDKAWQCYFCYWSCTCSCPQCLTTKLPWCLQLSFQLAADAAHLIHDKHGRAVLLQLLELRSADPERVAALQTMLCTMAQSCEGSMVQHLVSRTLSQPQPQSVTCIAIQVRVLVGYPHADAWGYFTSGLDD